MVDPRVFCLLVAFALAGCSEGTPPSEDPMDTGPGDADLPGSGSDASGSASAGPAEPSGAAPEASTQQAASSAAPVVDRCELGATAGAAAGGSSFTGTNVRLCSSVRLSSASGAAFRSAVVEMEWSNASPTLADVHLEVRDGSGVLGSAASAESPVRVELPAGAFEPSSSVDWSAMFGGTGAFADFQATVTFSLFESEAPPAGYTAL